MTPQDLFNKSVFALVEQQTRKAWPQETNNV